MFTYVPLQTGSVPNAPGASRAALCAGQQGLFWEMHDVLFDWQTRYGNTAFSQNRLLAGVEQLGMNGAAFTSCFNSADISATLNAALNEEVSSTPTIRVNGVTVDGGGTIPSAATILEAIDDATPDDWGREVEAPAEAPETDDPGAESAAAEADADAADEADQTAADPTPAPDPTDTPSPTVESEAADAGSASDPEAASATVDASADDGG